MKLSANFTLEELTRSDVAKSRNIDNPPPSYILPKLSTLAAGLEQIRTLLGDKPLRITSGYRCFMLNSAIGSKPTSQHITGNAADFVCDAYGAPNEIVKAIVESDIEYDQIICEHDAWVHVSFSTRNRQQALIIDNTGTRSFA